MKTYAEYLRSLGATEDDIKVLDTPIARKAYEAQQKAAADAETAREQAINERKATEDWYKTKAVPEFTAKQTELLAANARAAKFQAALRSAVDQGLIEVSDDLLEPVTPSSAPPANANPGSPAFDPNKYVTMDALQQVAEREGDAIAIAQDIAAEHMQLFPDKPLNMRELRKRAVASRKSVEQQWMEENKVLDARRTREEKLRNDERTKWREEGAKAERERLASQFNPDTRTPVPSTSPFTVRKTAGDIRAKQPWEAGSENVLSDERVSRVARKVLTQ